jgi:hypothetical protein
MKHGNADSSVNDGLSLGRDARPLSRYGLHDRVVHYLSCRGLYVGFWALVCSIHRWRVLVIWALPYLDGIKDPPAFLAGVDQIYLLWSSGLASGNNPTQADMGKQIGHELDAN